MTQPIRQYEALHWASSFLEEHGRETDAAEILLQHHLQIGRASFYMQMREPLKEEVWQAFRHDVKVHGETGVPIQHLTTTAPFYGRDFFVNGNVLIPRFETEELVAEAIRYVQERSKKADVTVVDIGTGSGVIAITLKLEVPEMTVYATDISAEALEVAKQNAAHHQAEVQFLQGDFLMPCVEDGVSPDVIISNPPYISYQEEASLQDTVKNFDPALALYAEENGLAAYRLIVEQIQQLPNPDGSMLFFEIGHEQGMAVQQIIRDAIPTACTKVLQDINGKDRIVTAVLQQDV